MQLSLSRRSSRGCLVSAAASDHCSDDHGGGHGIREAALRALEDVLHLRWAFETGAPCPT
jgi:hypothetical protein